MKMEWTMPQINDLKVVATQYSPKGGRHEDGAYKSNDGKYVIPTFASGVCSGTPDVEVKG